MMHPRVTIWAVLAALLCGAQGASALTTATKRAATCSDVTGTGTLTWTSPTNANTNLDASYANRTLLSSTASSHWLQCIGYGFTTGDIPTGSTIVGITVSMSR